MWIEAISFFLGVSILLYCLLAGADFGGGILELFLGQHKRQQQRELISHAMGPVWEANHMWLILAVVILFNGFPKAFAEISITFHIPLTLMLIGIILRGSSFTFRHYDVIQDSSQKYYSAIFSFSSIITPLFLGTIAGGILLGHTRKVELGYYSNYIAPWWNWFSFSAGIFLCNLFAFLAAVYSIEETEDEDLRRIFVKKATTANIAALFTGAFVFVGAELSGFPLFDRFTHDFWSIVCMSIATLILFPLWKSLMHHQTTLSRVLAVSQVTCILLGWFKIQFPVLVSQPNGQGFWTIYNAAAPDATLRFLLYALIGGSAVIFPSLYYLMHIFKLKPTKSR
jgi:cytochrome d ubiquinol oxidase subunit II